MTCCPVCLHPCIDSLLLRMESCQRGMSDRGAVKAEEEKEEDAAERADEIIWCWCCFDFAAASFALCAPTGSESEEGAYVWAKGGGEGHAYEGRVVENTTSTTCEVCMYPLGDFAYMLGCEGIASLSQGFSLLSLSSFFVFFFLPHIIFLFSFFARRNQHFFFC